MQMAPEEAIKSLASFAPKSTDELKDKICGLCCLVTDSTLSYFATMDAAERVLTMVGWSKSAMIHCSMIDKPIIYKVENTGLWGDAVRERKPVITNDYASLVKPTKRGYPDGHVRVRRHMNLPILEAQHIVMVVGVGNKTSEYTLDDAKALKTFMDAAWKTLKTKL